MTSVDVLIIGAGPAGAVCASLLQKAGRDCLLIDRAVFPRDKICGGGLTPKAWRLLDKLLPGVSYQYNSVRHISLMLNGIPGCKFDSEAELRIVKRRDFDNILLEYFKTAGGAFRHDALHTIEEQADGTILATLASGETVVCRYLIGADGSNSRVRRYLTGKSDHGILAMEQYMEKGIYDQTDYLEVSLTLKYDKRGYFYKFPNTDYDVVGYGDLTSTPQRFRQVLEDMHIPEGKFRGSHVYLSNDYPLHRQIILIGDAGGFASRVSCEGLYDAFKTARNAVTAILENRPFSETNKRVFAKKKREEILADAFFSNTSFKILRFICRYPNLVKYIFDIKMKRDSFLP